MRSRYKKSEGYNNNFRHNQSNGGKTFHQVAGNQFCNENIVGGIPKADVHLL